MPLAARKPGRLAGQVFVGPDAVRSQHLGYHNIWMRGFSTRSIMPRRKKKGVPVDAGYEGESQA